MAVLPTPEHGVLILLAWLGATRSRKGPQWCSRRGVGAARDALLTPETCIGSLQLLTRGATKDVLQFKLREASDVLALECRICGRCERGER